MKLIIAGSRHLNPSVEFIESALSMFEWQTPISEVVSGGAYGVDKQGENWAYWRGVKVTIILADWATHKKAAGPIRNRQMAEYADVLLLIWDNESKGSSNMKATMLGMNKPVYEVVLKKL